MGLPECKPITLLRSNDGNHHISIAFCAIINFTANELKMNGAELPCGTTLGVQPAQHSSKSRVNVHHRKKSTSDEKETCQQPTADQEDNISVKLRNSLLAKDVLENLTTSNNKINTVTVSSRSDDKNTRDDEDDELHDFFASLE